VSATPTIALSQSKIPCVGETVELEYSLTEALSFTYNLTGAPVQNTLTSLTGAIKLQNMVNNANISLTNIKSLQSGCQNNTPLTFAIKVDEKPIISPVYNLQTCSDESFSMPLGSLATVAVNWKATYNGVTGGIGTGTAAGALSETLINTGSTPILVSYELTPAILNNPSCSGNPVISTVTINPAPQFQTPSNIPDICGGAVINVPVSSSGGVIKWKRSNSQISGTGNIVDVAENTSGQTLVFNYALELGGCKNVITKTLALKVLPAPILNINQVPVLCNAFTDLT
jgi:hypothetical protein